MAPEDGQFQTSWELTNDYLLAQLADALVVHEDGDESLDSGKLAVHPKEKQHDEEEDRPQGGQRHPDQRLCEDDERQTRALGHLHKGREMLRAATLPCPPEGRWKGLCYDCVCKYRLILLPQRGLADIH